MAFDKGAFEERAAIMEYDGGLSRFRAETEAAKIQGVGRWEAINEISRRIVERTEDLREAMAKRSGQNNMSGVQQRQTEKT